jgi:tyrosine aminotransferase
MNVKKGATQLSQLHHGTSNLAQAAIPALLDPQTPGMAGWRETLRRSLEERSQLLCRGLERCPGVNVIPAQGAIYAIIEIDVGKLDFEHDLEFAMRLADEENVFVVPGMSMGLQNVVRLSFCSPEEILAVAVCRIESFCRRHVKPPRPPCAA